MEIGHSEFMDNMHKYLALKLSLPAELQHALPLYHDFLNPAKLTDLNPCFDGYQLSITGAKRWRMLQSVHAATLLRAHAIQRLQRKAWFDANPKANWWECPHDQS